MDINLVWDPSRIPVDKTKDDKNEGNKDAKNVATARHVSNAGLGTTSGPDPDPDAGLTAEQRAYNVMGFTMLVSFRWTDSIQERKLLRQLDWHLIPWVDTLSTIKHTMAYALLSYAFSTSLLSSTAQISAMQRSRA